MRAIKRAGGGVDRETWSRLMDDSVGEWLRHRLWVAVIREIATAAVEADLGKVREYLGYKDGSECDAEDLPTELVHDWQDCEMPADDLALILGEFDYFRNDGLCWEERLTFSGDPRWDYQDVVADLKEQLEPHFDAREAINEDLVESFYMFWRTRFLARIAKEAALIGR